MTDIETAMVDIAFACEVSELTELFKKHKHLHGSERFTKGLIKARGKIETRQSKEFQDAQQVVKDGLKIHKLQWKFLPRDEKK